MNKMEPNEYWEKYSTKTNPRLKVYSGIINTKDKFLKFVNNLYMNINPVDDLVDSQNIKEINGMFAITLSGIQSMLKCNFKLEQDDDTYYSELNNNEYYYRFTNSKEYDIAIIIKHMDIQKKYGINILSKYGFYININGTVINSYYFSVFDHKLSTKLKLDNSRITEKILNEYFPETED